MSIALAGLCGLLVIGWVIDRSRYRVALSLEPAPARLAPIVVVEHAPDPLPIAKAIKTKAATARSRKAKK